MDASMTSPNVDGSAPTAPACFAGQTRCQDNTVQVCTVDGAWSTKETCPAICASGACAGKCTPNQIHCGANQTPETCTALGEWAPGQPCASVCSGNGSCTGECKPGETKCGDPPNSLTPFVCDENGKWTARSPCSNVCFNGSCSGTCMPTSKRCGANSSSEVCNAMGAWEKQTSCPFVCSGNGECTGECKPKSKQCQGLTPQTCDDAGHWTSGAPCPNVCSSGACAGVCSPGDVRCNPNGRAVQTCKADGSGYADSMTCMFICANNACGGSCVPGAKSCSGGRQFTCQKDGTLDGGNACPAPSGGTAVCSGSSCGISCGSGKACGKDRCVAADGCCDSCSGACVKGTCNVAIAGKWHGDVGANCLTITISYLPMARVQINYSDGGHEQATFVDSNRLSFDAGVTATLKTSEIVLSNGAHWMPGACP
jgi:hypothetical protein